MTLAETLDLDAVRPPAGHPERFTSRWRLVAVGLSDVWRFGDLTMDAPSGRLLLRGSNGTGKTTALEALWPYLLDLNPRVLNAGKARTTSLKSLMAEGASGKKRVGYLWLTLVGPGSTGEWSYGVRLQWSTTAPVETVPFVVPGRPLVDVDLHGPDRATLNREDFTAALTAAGGTVFSDEDEYRVDMASRVWGTTTGELGDLPARLRLVRNPSMLGDLSAAQAADVLREALPTVDTDEVSATADALAASNETRAAFEADERAADAITDFATVWTGHVTSVVADAHTAALEAAGAADRANRDAHRAEKAASDAAEEAERTAERARTTAAALATATARIQALKDSDAYQGAAHLADRKAAVDATEQTARARWDALTRAAAAARARADTVTAHLQDISADLAAATARAHAADPAAPAAEPMVTWTLRARPVIELAGQTCDPGPEIVATADLDAVRSLGEAWTARAREHGTRAADATVALSDHDRTVTPTRQEAARADVDARRADAAADDAQTLARRAEADAAGAANALCDQIAVWLDQDTDQLTTQSWNAADVADLRAAEPGQVIAQAAVWRDAARRAGTELQARYMAEAAAARATAAGLRDDARAAREEAGRLRTGKLLPLPEPDWVTDRSADPDGQDDLLGACIDWAPGFTDPSARAHLESALSASGLLGARISATGVDAGDWAVTTGGPTATPNLTDALVADSDHPLSATVAAVLERVHLADTAIPGAAVLVIGRDATFTVGPAVGRAPGASRTGVLQAATHIGAHQRAQAALARATELDAHADALTGEATHHDALAAECDSRGRAVAATVAAFPASHALAAAETRRADRAQAAHRAEEDAVAARERARQTARAADDAALEWAQRTTARGLPADVDRLNRVRDDALEAERALNRVAEDLLQRVLPRAARDLALVTGRGAATLSTGDVGVLVAEARTARRDADAATAAYQTLAATVGEAAAQVTAELAETVRSQQALSAEYDQLLTAQQAAAAAAGAAETRALTARAAADAAAPVAQAAHADLVALMTTPGVALALAPTGAGQDWWTGDVVAMTGSALQGRVRVPRRTLQERYDAARALLAAGGAWTLDRGDIVAGLDLFALSHDGFAYDPAAAAAHAARMRDRARDALAAEEERALRDFVIGRLPAAVGLAWQRLHDWVNLVNRRMRSASASSGVLVQVRAELLDDLSPAQRSVYDLSCKVSDATRTREQRDQVGAALTQLIAAATGESLAERVAEAVDVRSWVRVRYEIDRGDGRLERWGVKTGLSGGERRLVVLAPMLAAIAAGYDSLGTTGLRLAALDEVPAEVDERGREGLARYLADLDLDLVATSYLWDGAPGAWDGIDAYDLEAGSDGTVVAFPMLVRGLTELPGDTR